MRARTLRGLAFAVGFSALPAVASAAIVIERPEIRASLGAQPTTAAYLTVRNTGPAADRLVSAACACAASVMTHATTTVNGVSRMSMEDGVAVPARAAVSFAPGGRHLMLTGVKRPIAAGDRISMVLQFEKAGRITVDFIASATPGMGADASQHHH